MRKKQNLLIKNISRKCNLMTIQQLNSINYAQIFKTSIRIDNRKNTIILNSNAFENFILSKLVATLKYITQKKKFFYQLQIINDNSLFKKDNKKVIIEIKLLLIIIQRHHEKLIFNIIRIATHDVVLKMPWLKKHNFILN